MESVASLRNLQFEEHFEVQRLPVMGDENALRRVIDILLDNALKYASPPGKVTLSANEKDGHVVVSVKTPALASHPRTKPEFSNASTGWTKHAVGNSAARAWVLPLRSGSSNFTRDPSP